MMPVGIQLQSLGTGAMSGRACASSDRKALICFAKSICFVRKKPECLNFTKAI